MGINLHSVSARTKINAHTSLKCRFPAIHDVWESDIEILSIAIVVSSSISSCSISNCEPVVALVLPPSPMYPLLPGLDGASSEASSTEALISPSDSVSSSFIVMILEREIVCVCVYELVERERERRLGF